MTEGCLGKHRENKAGLVTGFFMAHLQGVSVTSPHTCDWHAASRAR